MRVLWLGVILSALYLLGCTSANHLPPVSKAALETSAESAYYTVQPGDTIYSIAWEFGLDFLRLAQTNHLNAPYIISPGQRLLMTTAPRKTNTMAETIKTPPNHQQWVWPLSTSGMIVEKYAPGLTGNNGINITAPLNTAVLAANSGEIVYSSSRIRGYGNLVIIKHDRHWMSAYAFNDQLYVKVGQHVRRGEKIATIGRDNTGRVLLHFEIRQDGRPVNPFPSLITQGGNYGERSQNQG